MLVIGGAERGFRLFRWIRRETLEAAAAITSSVNTGAAALNMPSSESAKSHWLSPWTASSSSSLPGGDVVNAAAFGFGSIAALQVDPFRGHWFYRKGVLRWTPEL